LGWGIKKISYTTQKIYYISISKIPTRTSWNLYKAKISTTSNYLLSDKLYSSVLILVLAVFRGEWNSNLYRLTYKTIFSQDSIERKYLYFVIPWCTFSLQAPHVNLIRYTVLLIVLYNVKWKEKYGLIKTLKRMIYCCKCFLSSVTFQDFMLACSISRLVYDPMVKCKMAKNEMILNILLQMFGFLLHWMHMTLSKVFIKEIQISK
jgi:hypothetical protein